MNLPIRRAAVIGAGVMGSGIAAHFAEISDMSKARALVGAFEQTQKYVAQAAARAGVKL